LAAINTFNITIDSTNYQTNNGTIITNILRNSSSLYTLTGNTNGYYPFSVSNLNVSSNYVINFDAETYFNITAEDNASNPITNFSAVIDDIYYETTNGTIITHLFDNDTTLYNVNVFASGFDLYNNPTANITQTNLNAVEWLKLNERGKINVKTQHYENRNKRNLQMRLL
jgi:hypothetical protein